MLSFLANSGPPKHGRLPLPLPCRTPQSRKVGPGDGWEHAAGWGCGKPWQCPQIAFLTTREGLLPSQQTSLFRLWASLEVGHEGGCTVLALGSNTTTTSKAWGVFFKPSLCRIPLSRDGLTDVRVLQELGMPGPCQGGALASKDTQGLQIPAGGPGHPLCLSSLRSSTCNARNYSKLSSPWDKLYMFSCCSLKSLHSLLL